MLEPTEWRGDPTRRAETDDATRREEATVEPVSSCDYCGGPIAADEWHPVVTRRDDGELEIYAFCDETCREEWERDRDDLDR
ncbi:DUF2116 family Zn-ribbon domain-containing protein [Halorussus salilacus]|uniref:DUF2116 family Zn-ribbon domain-containing protein n=1 Tax=Halorussus salilacus TaxID=2953750 RepID=UPI00209E2D44|nr:DUF2116 family Zn-ribbon domain-containing protein [Halorussus salilacus]USZ68791.1 DUF2116 family Zn-ribbon domain-containing protein [Halorussus salilacus]